MNLSKAQEQTSISFSNSLILSPGIEYLDIRAIDELLKIIQSNHIVVNVTPHLLPRFNFQIMVAKSDRSYNILQT